VDAVRELRSRIRWNPRVQWWVTFEWLSITKNLAEGHTTGGNSGAQRRIRAVPDSAPRHFLNNFRNLSRIILGIWYYRKCRKTNLVGEKILRIFTIIFMNDMPEGVERSISYKHSKVINFRIKLRNFPLGIHNVHFKICLGVNWCWSRNIITTLCGASQIVELSILRTSNSREWINSGMVQDQKVKRKFDNNAFWNIC